MRVTVDITSEKGIIGYDLSRIIEGEIDERSKIGDLTVKKDDFYQLLAVEGNLRGERRYYGFM